MMTSMMMMKLTAAVRAALRVSVLGLGAAGPACAGDRAPRGRALPALQGCQASCSIPLRSSSSSSGKLISAVIN